jgi:hypothetical protein
MPSRHKETSVMPRSVPQTGQPKRRFNWPTGMPQIIALLLVLVVDSLVAPHFFQIVVQDGRLFGSPIDILNRAAPVALLAIGMTLVIATGGIDLSVGAVMAIAGATAASMTVAGHSLPVVLLVTLGTGVLAGLWNGVLVAILKIQPFVATLILMVAGRGVAQLITSGTPHVCTAEVFLRTEAQVRERLRFGNVVAFGCTLRNRFFRGRYNQLTVAAIQHEDVAGFRRSVNHRNGFAIYGNVCQRRLGRHIHIPQIVVDGLVAPGQFTGGCVQRHDRAGKTLLLWRTVPTPDIRRGHAHRQVNEVQLRVIGRRRPGVW